jgi:hypothetical protein
MNALSIIKKVLEIIQESMPAPNQTIDYTNHEENLEGAKSFQMTDTSAITNLARDFAKALNDRDFNSLDSRAEYHLYTVDHLVELVKNNDEENTLKTFKNYKIQSKYEDCEFLSITLNNSKDQAEVVYNVITCVVNADDKYFKELNKKRSKENQITQGTPFSTSYTLSVKKEKGLCKVDKFET